MSDVPRADGARGLDLDVVVLGHILNERVIFPDRVLYPALGSPAAYSSICLARLGCRVGIITKVGEDFPRNLLEAFHQAGVRQDGLSIGETSTRNELIYHDDGRKTLRFLSTAAPIGYADIPPEFRRATVYYFCPMDHEVDVAVVKRVSDYGKLMMVDLGGYGGATSERHPPVKDGAELERLCPYFDVVKASSEDLEYILGTASTDCERSAKRLLHWGAGVVVTTLGKDGALVCSRNESTRVPAYLKDQRAVVDQTGAGDCFSAGFLASYLTSREPVEAALYGNAVTSFVLERSGGALAERMPSRQEADRRAKKIRARMALR